MPPVIGRRHALHRAALRRRSETLIGGLCRERRIVAKRGREVVVVEVQPRITAVEANTSDTLPLAQLREGLVQVRKRVEAKVDLCLGGQRSRSSISLRGCRPST